MERFKIYKASAGSGKTYTLVRHYIETAIAVGSDVETRFSHILAITFTNKAANGMKERIMKRLYDIVTGDEESIPFVEEIADHLSLTADEVVARCSRLQTAILHNYSNFAVSTIDSFVLRLARTFAYEFHLPLNFDVMLEDKDLMISCVDELLSQAGHEGMEELTKVLCAYIENRMEDGKSYNVERQLVELAKEILKEETPKYLSQLTRLHFNDFLTLHRRLADDNRQVERQLKAHAVAIVDACKEEGLGVDDFPYKASGAFGYFLRFAHGDMQGINSPSRRAADCAAKGVFYAKSAPQNTRERIEKVTPLIISHYEAMQQIIEKERLSYNGRIQILANLYGLALLNRIGVIKSDYYAENESVHISEFNKCISDMIADEPAPFIYERVGSRYFCYLIDEFQDTSRMQFHNFYPLIDEAVSHGGAAGKGYVSLVVGDTKQAIYRFRQGDVRQFVRLPQVQLDEEHTVTIPDAVVEHLKCNYRTRGNVVEFNNRFFEWAVRNHFADNPELQQVYLGNETGRVELVQQAVKSGGWVSIRFVAPKQFNEQILAAIRHQVDDLHYKYGDILVLARDNATLVEISNYLSDNIQDPTFRLETSESFILSNSKVVLLLKEALTYLNDNKDRVAALQVLLLLDEIRGHNGSDADRLWRLRQCQYDLEAFFRDGNADNGSTANGNAANESTVNGNAANEIDANEYTTKENTANGVSETAPSEGIVFPVGKLRALSLYDCCEELLRGFGLQGRENGYVAAFLNMTANYVQHHSSDLGAFVSYLDDHLAKVSCATAPDENALQLMTIHKAKGLEAKIVIYALPDPGVHQSKLWVNITDDEAQQLFPAPCDNAAGKKESDASDGAKMASGNSDDGSKRIALPVAYVNVQKNESTFSSRFHEEALMEEMDRMNVFYVAMTRPMEKLIVVAEDVKSTEKENIALLRAYVTRSDSEFAEQEGSYVFGEDTQAKEEQQGKEEPQAKEEQQGKENAGQQDGATEEQPGVMDNVVFPQWTDRVAIASQSDDLLSPYDIDSRRYGVIVHDLMAHIMTAADVEPVVKRYCSQYRLADDVAEGMMARINSMMSDADNRRFFDGRWKVRCEIPMGVSGEVRRPDRVIFMDGETWVVDFKTGAYDKKLHQKYEKQVQGYVDAIAAMGYPNVRGKILYL